VVVGLGKDLTKCERNPRRIQREVEMGTGWLRDRGAKMYSESLETGSEVIITQ